MDEHNGWPISSPADEDFRACRAVNRFGLEARGQGWLSVAEISCDAENSEGEKTSYHHSSAP
jgi:hypothetical protein